MKLQSFSGAAFYARVCFVSLGIVGARRLRFHRSGIGPANAARQSPGDRCVGNALSFTATTLTVSKKGVVSLPADPRVSEGASPHIGIAVVGHPDVTADLSIAVRYDVAFVASFAGKPGFKGLDGLDGLPGSDGSAGSDDLSNPSAGFLLVFRVRMAGMDWTDTQERTGRLEALWYLSTAKRRHT
jgi:hypothetical protein